VDFHPTPAMVESAYSGFEDFGEQDKGVRDVNPYPAGFTATLGDNKVKIEFSPGGYRFSKYWKDDYSGNPRALENAMFIRFKSPQDAEQIIADEIKKYRGWTIELLPPKPINVRTEAAKIVANLLDL